MIAVYLVSSVLEGATGSGLHTLLDVSKVRFCKTKDKFKMNISLCCSFTFRHNAVLILLLGFGTKPLVSLKYLIQSPRLQIEMVP